MTTHSYKRARTNDLHATNDLHINPFSKVNVDGLDDEGFDEHVDTQDIDTSWNVHYDPEVSSRSYLAAFEPGLNDFGKRAYEDALRPDLQDAFERDGLVAAMPRLADRDVVLISNPFMPAGVNGADVVIMHPACSGKRTQVVIPEDGRIDGLIKLQFWRESEKCSRSSLVDRIPMRYESSQQKLASIPASSEPVDEQVEELSENVLHPIISTSSVCPSATSNASTERQVTYLPPQFGRPRLCHREDKKLFSFYVYAICAGRTVIPTCNLYLQQFASMATSDECVKHAILSLSASYVLDFERSDHLLDRANVHERRAVQLVGEALNADSTYSPGKEDGVLAAIVLLAHNEGVNLGAESEADPMPPWWRAMKTAEHLLSVTDPAYRYANPDNVQCSRARFQVANRVGLFSILSCTVAPIEKVAEKCDFNWLLHGTEKEQRQVLGTTGFCSKLMHIFAQITHLTGRSQQTTKSKLIPAMAKALQTRLENFQQWSDLSEGYPTSAELIASCQLDPDGLVTTAREVTELCAESYVAAAQIYLQCRLMRRPRSHPDVQEPRDRLMKCIKWCPVSGPLFSAQAPLYAAFIAGLVAETPEQREVVRGYFEPIIALCRGNNVKPWRAVQFAWDWLDSGNGDRADAYSEASERGWWEDLVQHIFTNEGRMDLA